MVEDKILDRIEADLMQKTLTMYPVLSDTSTLYATESSLEDVKDKLTPWIVIENISDKTNGKSIEEQANEYMERFVIPNKMKRTTDG